MSLIKVQTMKQNTANWKYDLKSNIEYVNHRYIKRITPRDDVHCVYLEGDDQESENYCDDCLEKSFIGEEDTLKEYTDEYEGN